MSQFRKYFVLIIAFVVFGCTPNDSTERPEETSAPDGAGGPGPDSGEVVQGGSSSGPEYTISIASGSESVYAYYSERNSLPLNEERFFRLSENECLRVMGGQFQNLSIFASRGQFNVFRRGADSLPGKTLFAEKDNYTPLCNALFQCNPGNYSIAETDVGFTEWTDKDEFTIRPVEVGVFQDQCDYFYNADKWMEFKVRQYVLSGAASQGNVASSLKSQIEEWSSQ